jgi:antitoxin ParD1/3/4
MAATLNISLSAPLKAYVDAQTEAGNFGTPQEFIRELIQDDRDRHRRNLEDHLLASLKEKANGIEIPEDVLESGDVVGYLEATLQKRG